MLTLSLVLLLCFDLAFGSKPCNAENLREDNNCSPTEFCNTKLNQCQCFPGLIRINESFCSDSNATYSSRVENEGGGSLLAGILIPLALILIVLVIVLFRKYRVVPWLRLKLQQRSSNYDEFMIGRDDDDDPPLG